MKFLITHLPLNSFSDTRNYFSTPSESQISKLRNAVKSNAPVQGLHLCYTKSTYTAPGPTTFAQQNDKTFSETEACGLC